jgi:large subunit ribosomal protein L15
MDLSNLRPPKGATHSKKRIGRARFQDRVCRLDAATRAKSRSGFKHKRGEGGQMPLHRRVPKRGSKPARQEFEVVNLDALAAVRCRTEVTPELLREQGLIGRAGKIKVLARGDISKALTVRAQVQRQGGREDRRGRW